MGVGWRRLAFTIAAILLPILGGCGSSRVASSNLSGKPALSIPSTSSSSTTQATSPSTTTCSVVADIGHWSDERLASQMLAISSEMGSLSRIEGAFRGGVGGVVLTGSASLAAPALKAELAKLESFSPDGIPPLVMADEEGGGIQVLSSLVGSMPWPRTMAQTISLAGVEALTHKIGTAMRSLGVTMDLAPVVDLDAGPGPSETNPDGSRSFSANPRIATEYAKAFEAGLEKAGVVPVLKHFPGLGGASGNTDFMAAHTLPFSSLVQSGLIPFEKLAPSAEVVMVSNASIPGLTNGVPSSMSSKAIGTLRKSIGFNGVIITDSLETVSISSYQPNISKAVVDAAGAGADLVMLASSNPNQMPVFLSARSALAQAIASGTLSRSKVEASVARILSLKGVSPGCVYY